MGGCEIRFAPLVNHGKPLFVGIYRGIVLPGSLRWCRISSMCCLHKFPQHMPIFNTDLSNVFLSFAGLLEWMSRLRSTQVLSTRLFTLLKAHVETQNQSHINRSYTPMWTTFSVWFHPVSGKRDYFRKFHRVSEVHFGIARVTFNNTQMSKAVHLLI